VGAHNLANILSAAGAATALALPLEALSAGLVATRRIPGRLERVPDPRGARTVFVDYAHTPDALQNVLAALRQVGPRRLICLFGCGGDRDRAKRPLMGAIAGRLADVCLVTSDNPRSEDPEAIIAEILPGLEQAGARAWDAAVPGAIPPGSYMVLPDRRAAIRRAVALARPGDAVLLAGKGHEAYQVVGARRLPFDDVEEAAAALAQVDPPGGAP
jgi:UDP-N-acetylmuramyl-tripeptide synthetase